ncbi:hypothetical protein E2C01_068540 [Portunus trituberculatus]|uniref:Uncharacterized protein n=1 Tax=Portunus trituberculatus TaxID=210409 RepID=A0A5B7HP35_PORTR|nr:hypothetical protein [Portunus trituberculatus]
MCGADTRLWNHNSDSTCYLCVAKLRKGQVYVGGVGVSMLPVYTRTSLQATVAILRPTPGNSDHQGGSEQRLIIANTRVTEEQTRVLIPILRRLLLTASPTSCVVVLAV